MPFFESIFYMAWRGLAIGLIISAPMGPVGMLCIQRTLDKGRRAGFYTGIGAALSDLFYCLLTGLGLSFIEEFLEKNSNVIQLAGSFVLIAFGIYLFRQNPSKKLKKPVEEHVSKKKSILGGFLFTFSNPLILFLTIGLFARFNFLLPEFRFPQYLTGYVFIILGALLWWWLITFSISKVRNHFNIRSMWLINKIIGGIIILFAIVGMFTATSALVSATEMRCWNEARGFKPFSTGTTAEGMNVIRNDSRDTLRLLVPCEGANELEFRFKVKNHRVSPAKKYKVTGTDGDQFSVRQPSWGLVLKDTDGSEILVGFNVAESESDGVSTQPCLEIDMRVNGSGTSQKSLKDRADIIKKILRGGEGPDPTGSHNFFKLSVAGDIISLNGGEHSPINIISEKLPFAMKTDSIGFFLAPGAEISPYELRLATASFPSESTPWDSEELLGEYLDYSRDPLEGYWQVLDRSLEESLLRLGGDYRLAIVKAQDGYDLIYLSGAKVNADGWHHGMKKGHLSPSGIGGVWNVCWIDAMGKELSHELKSQTSGDGVLTLLFPYHNSQIRLIRTN